MGFSITPIREGEAMGYLEAVAPRVEAVSVGLVGLTTTCYRCGRQGVALAGVIVDPAIVRVLVGVEDDLFLDFEPVGEALRDALDPVWLREHFAGPLKVRTSRQRPDGYMSNGCHACDAIVGSYPLHEAVAKIGMARLPEFVIRQVTLPLDALRVAVEPRLAQGEW